MPVGTSAEAIISLANCLLPSRAAAAWFGPKTAMPCSRSASATPATSGASGPITTRSAASASASFTTSSRSVATTSGFTSTSRAIPSLPGAQTMFSRGVPVRTKALTMACSLAPEPITRIFTFASLPCQQLGIWPNNLDLAGGEQTGKTKN